MSYTSTAIAGYGGIVEFASGTLFEITNWTANLTWDTHDVSYMTGNGGDHSRRYVPCIKGMTGEFDSLSIGDIALPNPASLAGLGVAYDYTATITLKTKALNGVEYSALAGCNKLTLDDDAKALGVFKFSFVATGEVEVSLPIP